MDKPLVLRSPSGPNKGKYLKSANYKGINWTDNREEATSFSVEDAYGNLACSLDMCFQVVVPELVEEENKGAIERFASILANDMFRQPQESTIKLVEKIVRKPSDPFNYKDISEDKTKQSDLGTYAWYYLMYAMPMGDKV